MARSNEAPSHPVDPSTGPRSPASPGLVLDLVRTIVEEVRPDLAPEVTLESRLDADLGLDSLTVIELRERVERACEVVISDDRLADLVTAGDLVRLAQPVAVPAGHPAAAPARSRPPPPPFEGVPGSATTLLDALAWHVDRHPERVHTRLLLDDGSTDELTYGALWHDAETVAAGLQERGVRRGDSVALMLPTGRDHLTAFLGIVRAGAVPVPVYPPMRPSQLEAHVRRQEKILDNAGSVLLVTSPEARRVARWLRRRVSALEGVVTVGHLATGDAVAPVEVGGHDTALLQYTSGSTGSPKGVVLDHRALLANIRAMGRAARIRPDDVFVSWLPLYHDMGLIGAWMGSLYFGMTLVLMSPLAFLSRPARWLWAIHDHRGTITASPNFGFEVCSRRVDAGDLVGLDLSSLRLAFNGAEPVSPDTIERFEERFAPFGFSGRAMAPVYGLAEAAVGLAFPPVDRGPRIDTIERDPFARNGRAIAIDGGAPRSGRPRVEQTAEQPAGRPVHRFVSCGRALPGYDIRVVDRDGSPVPERREGRIEFRGPSATSGYFRNPEATAALQRDGWLDTGDLGYLADGEVYVTGRVKDLVIRAGRNIHPDAIETAVGDLPGIRKGCVAVFGMPDPESRTERLLVVAETRATRGDVLAELRHRVTQRVTDVLGAPPNEVVLAAPGAVRKTSSGKVRRGATRAAYGRGELTRPARSVWVQVARAEVRSGREWVRGLLRAGPAGVYTLYAWGVVALLGSVLWCATFLVPGLERRRRLARWAARVALRAVRVPVDFGDAVRLPSEGPAVLVVNHQSLADGVVLVAAAPRTPTFVAAEDWVERPVVGRILRGLGCEVVSRRERGRAAADTERFVARVGDRDVLAFFPEGRVSTTGDLQPFRMGAFVVAARSGAAVVPVVLDGTRALLRPGERSVHRHAVRVRVGEAIVATGDTWADALRLKEAAREVVTRLDGDVR